MLARCFALALALSISLSTSTGALADEPAPDALPKRVEEAARAAFAEAQAADVAGDLTTAIERYRYVQKIAPHPSVTYNLADVLRRKHDIRGAAREYRAYLKALPTAPDRVKVEKVIATLEATPAEVEVDTRATDGVIFIDGVRQTTAPPIFVEMTPGPHRFDMITAISFRSLVHDVDFARDQSFSLTPPARVDGNVVLSGSGWLERAKVTVDGATTGHHRLGELVALTPGKRALEVVVGDCRWSKTITAPAGDVLYVYLTVPPPRPPTASKAAPKPTTTGRPVKPPAPVCGKGKFTITRVTPPPPSAPAP